MKSTQTRRVSSGGLGVVCLFFVAALGPAPAAWGQGAGCLDNAQTLGRTVREVKVVTRWGAVPSEPLPLRPGQTIAQGDIARTNTAVSQALSSDGLQSNARFAVTYVDSCVRAVGQDSADVIVRPFTLRLGMGNIAENLLALPRSNKATVQDASPPRLTTLKPTIDANTDREYGVSLTGGIDVDLAKLTTNTALTLKANGQKSLDQSFYAGDVSFGFKLLRPLKIFTSAQLEGTYSATEDPRAAGQLTREALSVSGSLGLQPSRGALSHIDLGGSFASSSNDFVPGAADAAMMDLDEQIFDGRVIFSGRIGGGFTRLALWGNYADPKEDAGAYRRIAATLGYANEIPITLNQTIGLELLVGAGTASDDTPDYARFFGGNELGNFLNDATDSQTFTAFPAGPLLRSTGTRQADVRTAAGLGRGGTSYWHVNLDVSLPIKALSRPLIPKVEVAPNLTLNELLKRQVQSGESFLVVELQSQGLSREKAEARAKEIMKQIQRPVDYIADYANLYAIRPLFMFDVMRLDADDLVRNRTRVAAGAGIQLLIVVARFEAGYMRAIRRAEGDAKGNFIVRLSFMNLF